MNPEESEMSVEQEVAQVAVERPHVVVLGAGASRAACPAGDKHGRVLPLMNDLGDLTGILELLRSWGLDDRANFEEIFSQLYEAEESEKIATIQEKIEEYFGTLELPETPTIYDHLVLSLRGKDLIATFNWDPLLMKAYLRNREAGLTLPRLAFLHGNVLVGHCLSSTHKTAGVAGNRCSQCGQVFERSALLYPIKKKNYAENQFIANEWKQLRRGFKNAFMITIFGYSGPKTDEEAIYAMKEAWGESGGREMEQTSFIVSPTQDEDELVRNWKPFIHTHHYEVQRDFYDSWLANHPRRTGEAWWNQYLEVKFIDNNPIPKNLSLPDLWDWYERFKEAESGSPKAAASGGA